MPDFALPSSWFNDCRGRRLPMLVLALVLAASAWACSPKATTPDVEEEEPEDILEEDAEDLDATATDGGGDVNAKDIKDVVKTDLPKDVDAKDAVDVVDVPPTPDEQETADDNLGSTDEDCLDDACLTDDGDGADTPDGGGATGCTTAEDCAGLAKAACVSGYACKDDGSGAKACVAIVAANDVACDDKDLCTVKDRCFQGVCVGIPRLCTGHDPCNPEKCQPAKGCQAVNPGEVPCSDENPCTDGDMCGLGYCNGGTTNKCACGADADCAQWDDGNLCNGSLKCEGGACVFDAASVPLPCENTANVDTTCLINACVPATGLCALKLTSNGAACSDGSACTLGDLCSDGACVGKAVACSDGNPCTDDSCVAAQGCVHQPNASPCNDGDACTFADTCKDAVCKGKASDSCSCSQDSECPNDADLCNGSYVCVDKLCVLDPKTIVTCGGDGDPACVSHTCDAKTGKCGTAMLGGAPCSDGSACTVGDSCSDAGVCGPGAKTLNCNDGDACTDDACNAALGCVHTFNAAPCEDGDPCTQADKCLGGVCSSGPSACSCKTDADCSKFEKENKCFGPFTCKATVFNSSVMQCTYDPANVVVCSTAADTACSKSVCKPSLGSCVALDFPSSTPCSDADPCTVADQCISGVCQGQTTNCDDGNECSADSCDAKAGGCLHDVASVDGKVCADGSACTEKDTCLAGACAGVSVECDDGEPCTADECEPESGCVHPSAPLGQTCDDGDPCTGDPGNANVTQDLCNDLGKCLPGSAKSCNDGNLCTDDSCDKGALAKAGCVNMPNSVTCTDGDACTDADACAVGLCNPGTATNCDDGLSCTDDSCDKLGGCMHDANTQLCDDSDVCTEIDTCGASVCSGKAVDCDDDNPCTADSCDSVTGCQHSNVAGNCGAFAACTNEPVSVCAFGGGGHVVISEIYVGVPDEPGDDWVELYNPTTLTATIGDYALEVRPADSTDKADWTVIAQGSPGQNLPSHGYLLLGHTSPVVSSAVLDVASTQFKLDGDAQQLRLRDVTHELVHDSVSWGQAAAGEGAPLFPWLSSRSMERRANFNSTAETMYQHGEQWLSGNAYDTNDNFADFYLRWAPDPQNGLSGQFEPACGATCPVMKICNYQQPAGTESCVPDSTCKNPCGAGKSCNATAQQCVLDSLNAVVLSELYMGNGSEDGQFIELHNSGGALLDLSAYALQTKAATADAATPWTTLMQWPAGTLLPPKGYLVAGTQTWANLNGSVDAVVAGSLNLDPAGGSARLWDPRTNVELDLIGWGNAKQVFGTKPAQALTVPGTSLERKASAQSSAQTMQPGGSEYLAGNGVDSDVDFMDWLAATGPSAQSHGSGAYEPACANLNCTSIACNYVPGGEQCVDPACGGICNITATTGSNAGNGPGSACNIKNGKCDRSILIAEIAAEGPDSKDQTGFSLAGVSNEYVMLYNPTGASINLKGLVLQFWNGATPTSGTYTSMTDSGATKPLVGTVEPHRYFLIAPQKYDKNLPTPDFIANKSWDFKGDQGYVRIARISTPNFPAPNGTAVADSVAYGDKLAPLGEGKAAATPQIGAPQSPGSGGAMRRRAAAGVRGADLANPFSPWYYAGAGWDTNVNSKDWVTLHIRQPQNSKTAGPRLP